MGNFNRGGGGNRFGGGDRGRSGGFGGRDGRPRPSFDKQMHRAICAECSKPCEVPFRPTDGKPVFCSSCFSTKGGMGEGRESRGDRFPRRDFGDRKPNFENANKGMSNDALAKKVDELHVKLDRLTKIVEAFKNSMVKDVPVVSTKEEKVVSKEVVETAEKTPAKKVTKKKVVAKKGK